MTQPQAYNFFFGHLKLLSDAIYSKIFFKILLFFYFITLVKNYLKIDEPGDNYITLKFDDNFIGSKVAGNIQNYVFFCRRRGVALTFGFRWKVGK